AAWPARVKPSGSTSGGCGRPVRSQSARDDLDDRVLRAAHIVLAVGQLPEGPAGEDLFQRAVPDRRRQASVDVLAKLTRRLATLDDPLERLVGKVDLVGLLLHLRAACHLSDEHAN